MFAVAGCGGGTDDAVVPTGSALFDPCRDISDALLGRAGFDPATKTHPAPEFPDRCTVQGKDGSGQLLMEHSRTVGEMPQFDRALALDRSGSADLTATTVNGRDAYTVPRILGVFGSTTPMGCDANLRTKLGMLRIHTGVNDSCASVMRVATLLEPAIGPGPVAGSVRPAQRALSGEG